MPNVELLQSHRLDDGHTVYTVDRGIVSATLLQLDCEVIHADTLACKHQYDGADCCRPACGSAACYVIVRDQHEKTLAAVDRNSVLYWGLPASQWCM